MSDQSDAAQHEIERLTEPLGLRPLLSAGDLDERYGALTLRQLLLEVGRLQRETVPLNAACAGLSTDPAVVKKVRGHVLASDGRFQQLRYVVEGEVPAHLRRMLAHGARQVPFAAKGSIGQGLATPVPWCRAYSNDELDGTRTAQSGFYVVYLFADDGQSVSLSFNQGTDADTGGTISERAAIARDQLRELSPELTATMTPTINLLSDPPIVDSERARKYEQGNALATVYRLSEEDLPPDALLDADFASSIELQERFYLARRDQQMTPQPAADGKPALHILLKWNDPNSEMMAEHQAVAAAQGSVWWGNNTERSTSVDATKVTRLNRQVDEGTPTHAYLYRGTPREAWVTDLLQITTQRHEVDDRLASSTDAASCNPFVLLKNFRALDPDSLVTDLVLDSNPSPGSLTQKGLSNQQSPMYVREVAAAPAPDPAFAFPSSMEDLVKATGWELDRLEAAITALTSAKPQIILAGPPGTGKTWVAKALAAHLTGGVPARSKLVQFHPSYGYEEFVEGLRPGISKRTGAIKFRERPGTLMKFAGASEDGHRRVMILDEMNRANLPRVLGELMYALEYRDEPVDLLYTQAFRLPPTLSFIGTMNTADRSIRSIDIALRRRFEIFECPPDPALIASYYADGLHTTTVNGLADGLHALNEKLTSELDRHHTVGHSFFMADSFTASDLRRVWDRQIFPLIEEYFFDQPEVANGFKLEELWPGAHED